MPKPKDIHELTDELLEAYEWVKQDPRRVNQVSEMANVAGKILGSLKTQMQYAALKGEEPDIPFMGKTSGKPLKTGVKLLNG